MAEKRMKEKSIEEMEEDFLAYGKKEEWHSLETSALDLAIRYMANEQYAEAFEAIVAAMAIQVSGCSEANRVCKYDDVAVSTYCIGMIRYCGEKLSLSQEEREKKVKELLISAFAILPFSYYEPETALSILKDCRNKPFDPKKYNRDHVAPKEDKSLTLNDADEKRLKGGRINQEAGGFVTMRPCPCL